MRVLVREPTAKQWHELAVDEALARLGAAREGLSDEEAARRLATYGPNALPEAERALPLVILLRQVRSPLIYVLVTAAVVTAALGKYVDTGVILFLIPTGLGLVLTVIASIVLRLPLPFLPAQVIWINLVTNGTQDVAMAFEPAEEDVGRRPPRDPNEPVFTRPMAERTVLVGLVLLAGTLGVFLWQLWAGAGLEHARTVALTTMVLFQNFHIFNSRSFTQPFYRISPLSNRFLLLSVGAALVLQVLALYWGPLQFVLRTEPLSPQTWLVMMPVAATVLLAVEIDKAIRRRRRAG